MSSQQKPLVIDAQLLQTTAWDRGMGHYCKALLKAFAANDNVPEITLILNKNLDFSAERKDTLQKIMPTAKFVSLDLPTISSRLREDKRRASRCLTAFLAEAYPNQTVDFLLLQLFTFDYCAAFPEKAHKLVICYDLIPLIYWSNFSSSFASHMYFPHLSTLYEADTVLAISNATAKQLEEQLSLPPSKIVDLKGATITREASPKFSQLSPDELFIVMPSADLPHKNNQAAVQAFTKFNRRMGDIFRLVITSTMSEQTREQLSLYTDKLLFTGNLNDQDLQYVYAHSQAVMLISSIEGLGLPVLEAVEEDKPVVCSSIDVFREISDTAFYYCQPTDEDSIASALEAAVAKADWASKLEAYKAIRQEYTWSNSAEKLRQSLRAQSAARAKKNQAKLSLILPQPASTSSQLGGFVQSLVPAFLDRVDEVRAYLAENQTVDNTQKPYFLPYMMTVGAVSDFLSESTTAVKPLYFIDDSDASYDVLRAAILRPGVCFITSKHVKDLVNHLANQGYISSELALYSTKLTNDSLAKLLSDCGNQVYALNTQKLSLKSQANDKAPTISASSKAALVDSIIDQVLAGRH